MDILQRTAGGLISFVSAAAFIAFIGVFCLAMGG
jgi:hypothetical protein